MRRYLFAILVAILPFFPILPLRAAGTIELDYAGQRLEGSPLQWSNESVHLLSRDGRWWTFPPSEAENFRRVSPVFNSFSQGEIRGRLQREFGRRFEVTAAGSYVVVHPAGQGAIWATRFDQLNRSFRHYFTARGFQLQRARFPLVAIVFATREEFFQAARREHATINPGVLGYYSLATNRVMIYDQTQQGRDWSENAETITHEAAHQSAFNTGVHSRFSPPPRWVTEGLGVMFETRGVWNSRRYTKRSDRIQHRKLAAFRRYLNTRPSKSLAEWVSSDRPFRANPQNAYAQAWALSFYLSETQPRKYIRFLAKTASRPDFTRYRGPERLQDFRSAFGQDLTMLETRFLRFIAEME